MSGYNIVVLSEDLFYLISSVDTDEMKLYVAFHLGPSLFVKIPILGLPRTLVKSVKENLIFLFLNQNICYGYSNEPSQ